MLLRRRRMVDAMGLGPLWIARSRERAPTPVESPSSDRLASIATMDLDQLTAAVTTCRACALCATRTHAVFGDGTAQPHWLVIGPAPSRDDDVAAAPMTGQPGRLLDAMLAAVDRSRQRDVFVTTAVKCRPPDGRDASPIEIETCRPYLDRQIELMAPRLLFALGDEAALAVSGSRTVRGGRQAVVSGERTVPLLATHHPSRLLDEPHLKAEAWADLCVARGIADC